MAVYSFGGETISVRVDGRAFDRLSAFVRTGAIVVLQDPNGFSVKSQR